MTETEVKRLFLAISNMYPSFEADELKVSLWHEALKDYPMDDALNNLKYHIKTQKFQPTVAEIRLGKELYMNKGELRNLRAKEKIRQAMEEEEREDPQAANKRTGAFDELFDKLLRIGEEEQPRERSLLPDIPSPS